MARGGRHHRSGRAVYGRRDHATNRRLQDPALDPDVPEVRALLRRWGLLHLVRTALGLGAAGWMLRLLATG
jgi:hypothetical protein